MPEKIKLKRFKSTSFPEEFIEDAILDQNKKSNNQFLNRFYKTSFVKKRTGLARESFTILSFRRNWFCKNCMNVFDLKPISRFKTLLEYNTNCSKCGSENAVHNEELSKAIIEKKSTSELTIIAEKFTNINLSIINNSKYFPTLYNTSTLKTSNTKDREYFNLNEIGL